MITGEIKTKIDNIWDAFWTGGITNSITVLEQMTYLFFMKMLDDAQRKKILEGHHHLCLSEWRHRAKHPHQRTSVEWL